MHYKGPGGITIIEGLDAVRRRPTMYIGAAEPGKGLAARLLECIVDGVARDVPPPAEIRVSLWSDGAITVAFDGVPLPIEPFARSGNDVAHPALYRFFMNLFGGAEPIGRTTSFGAILNALSEWLVVSTMHGDARYRVVFAQGRLETLLSRRGCAQPLGTNWFTFRPDPTLIASASLSMSEALDVAERVAASVKGPPILVHDRTAEEPDWG